MVIIQECRRICNYQNNKRTKGFRQAPRKSDIMKIIIRDYTKKTIQDLTGDGYILLQNAFFVNLEMPSFPDLLLLMQLRDHTKKTIQDLTKNGYCLLDFSKLRDALLSRLTQFKERRGGEPNTKTVGRQGQNSFCSKIKWKEFLCNTKVAYFLASKIAKLVPVIIPTDCLKALSILTYVEVRRSVGINPNNVFPNTKNSMGHVIGWDYVNRKWQEGGLERKRNASSKGY